MTLKLKNLNMLPIPTTKSKLKCVLLKQNKFLKKKYNERTTKIILVTWYTFMNSDVIFQLYMVKQFNGWILAFPKITVYLSPSENKLKSVY